MADIFTVHLDTDVHVRDEAKRELDIRLMPWGQTVETVAGPEEFARGAFDGTDPASVFFFEPEHGIRFGIGQDGQPKVTRHPVGRFTSLESREDAQYGTVKVAATSAGDDVLALAREGLVSGISVEFAELPGGTDTERRKGRRVKVHRRARLSGATTTYQPAYPDAAVLAVRSEGDSAVSDAPALDPVQPAPPAFDPAVLAGLIGDAVGSRIDSAIQATEARTAERFDQLQDQARSAIVVPGKGPEKPKWHLGDWTHLVLRVMSGDTVRNDELQARVAADLVTADNLGVIPTAYLSELIGFIDPARPFLSSTRRIGTPAAGMQLSVPKIVTRPTVGVQADEKDELASTPTSIVPVTFDSQTVGGYGDISLQLLKRSDPSYLQLYLQLLAEAYSVKADDLAVDALLAEADVHEGGTIDPNDGPQFGAAWANASAVSRLLAPDTIWMSSDAIASFIDAKSSTTNAPLYANLAGNFTAGGGAGGTISGLRPVHVPALDDEAVDVIVGPSRGFAWCEDGEYILQVDVPSKAGRDVALVSMLWFAPLYPLAFTSYVVAVTP